MTKWFRRHISYTTVILQKRNLIYFYSAHTRLLKVTTSMTEWFQRHISYTTIILQKRNLINCLKGNNCWISDRNAIGDQFLQFHNFLFTTISPDTPTDLENLIDPILFGAESWIWISYSYSHWVGKIGYSQIFWIYKSPYTWWPHSIILSTLLGHYQRGPNLSHLVFLHLKDNAYGHQPYLHSPYPYD